MKHLNEEQLVLHYYGEDRDRAGAGAHMQSCQTCRSEFERLRSILDAFDQVKTPERGELYGAEVWNRIRPEIAGFYARPAVLGWFTPSRWIAAAAMAALILVAFLAGRVSHQRQDVSAAGISGRIRQRILLVAVGDHLERSRMILVELANAEPGRALDISGEQRRAEDLINENRLYRQTALRSGDTAVAGVLDDLERVLLEIAHSPSEISSPELEQLRQRIEAEAILFKVRVVESNIRDSERTPGAGSGRNKLLNLERR